MTENFSNIDSNNDDHILSNNSSNETLPNSTAVLVLGILSILGCVCYGVFGIILGIVALVLFKKDKVIYDSNPEKYAESFKNLNAGKICAIIGLSISVAYFLFWLIYILFFVGLLLNLPFDQNFTNY